MIGIQKMYLINIFRGNVKRDTTSSEIENRDIHRKSSLNANKAQ